MGLILSLLSSSVNPGNFRNTPGIYDRLNVVLRTKARDTPVFQSPLHIQLELQIQSLYTLQIFHPPHVYSAISIYQCTSLLDLQKTGIHGHLLVVHILCPDNTRQDRSDYTFAPDKLVV